MGMIPIEKFSASKFDIDAMVDAVTKAEIAPLVQQQKRRESNIDIELTALGTFTSMVSNMVDSVKEMTTADAEFFRYQIHSSAPEQVLAYQQPGVSPSFSGTHKIAVQALASEHRLQTSTFSDSYAPGAGTIELRTMGGSATIVISNDMTLAAIANAINQFAAKYHVNAQIIPDGYDQRLFLSSDLNGKESEIHVSGTDGGLIITDSLVTIQEPHDAAYLVDGAVFTSNKNKVTNSLFPGVILEFLQPTTVDVEIHASASTRVLKDGLIQFINSYNQLVQKHNYMLDTKSKEGSNIPQVMRSMQSKIHKIMGTRYKLEDTKLSLAEIGVSTMRDSTLYLDQSVFGKAVTSYGSNLVGWSLQESGPLIAIQDTLDSYINSSSLVTKQYDFYSGEVRKLQQDQMELENYEKMIRTRFTKQYTSMDSRVNAYKSIGEHIDVLSNMVGSNKK